MAFAVVLTSSGAQRTTNHLREDDCSCSSFSSPNGKVGSDGPLRQIPQRRPLTTAKERSGHDRQSKQIRHQTANRSFPPRTVFSTDSAQRPVQSSYQLLLVSPSLLASLTAHLSPLSNSVPHPCAWLPRCFRVFFCFGGPGRFCVEPHRRRASWVLGLAGLPSLDTCFSWGRSIILLLSLPASRASISGQLAHLRPPYANYRRTTSFLPTLQAWHRRGNATTRLTSRRAPTSWTDGDIRGDIPVSNSAGALAFIGNGVLFLDHLQHSTLSHWRPTDQDRRAFNL